MKKKSLVGWTDKDWKMFWADHRSNHPNNPYLCIPIILKNHSKCNPLKFWKKICITIEEIK